MIFLPYKAIEEFKGTKKHPSPALYHFYELPVAKMWTNTLFYIAFLLILSIVCIEPKQLGWFTLPETVLIIWMSGLIVDEVMQFVQDPDGHFDGFWNYVLKKKPFYTQTILNVFTLEMH
jgi:hypothetical protein